MVRQPPCGVVRSAGTVLTVLSLLLLAGWNGTAYYPSLTDMQSSLTISNSSSSLFTLRTMAWVSLFVPFVAAYIWYAWRAMNRRPITREEIRGDDHKDFGLRSLFPGDSELFLLGLPNGY